jgi:mRNA-degrading endonuclease RelE of RelBE toxin-antitoxin system
MEDFQQISRNQDRWFHQQVQPVVKGYVEGLKENPFLRKPLEKKLSGYYSLRSKRFRIISTIDGDNHVIQIRYVGRRRDVYELLRELLSREKDAYFRVGAFTVAPETRRHPPGCPIVAGIRVLRMGRSFTQSYTDFSFV